MRLREFILSHNNWEELLSTDPYNLKIMRDGEYILFMYNQLNSDFSLPEVQEARGVIFHEKTWRVVCRAFDKFFNYGEPNAADIDWHAASVQEKVDGSLMKLWYDAGEWHVSTNGSINAFKTPLSADIMCPYKTFGDLFMAALPKSFDEIAEKCYKTNTYIFELVSPWNQVVINYDTAKLYFLGFRETATGIEFDAEESILKYDFDIPERFPLTDLESVQDAASKLGLDQEGFVVRDRYFRRVKIKSPDYITAHYITNNNVITVRRLIDIIRNNEEDEFRVYAARYIPKLDEVKEAITQFKSAIMSERAELANRSFNDKHEMVDYVKTRPKYAQPFLFAANASVDEKVQQMSINSLIRNLEQGGFLHD